MPLFGIGRKKDAPAQAMSSAGPPTDLVLQMRQQGLSNNQIIQNLQRQGYATTDIFDAMNQADIKGGVEAAPAESFNPEEVENPMSFGAMPYGGPPPGATGRMNQPTQQMPLPPMPMQPQMPPSQTTSMPAMSGGYEQVEELVEAIIDERWNELMTNINKIAEWKTSVDNKIIAIDQQIKDLKSQFEELHTAILSKINEYDQNITNVGTEIKAMEQVFEKVLPKFTENVRELSRITDTMQKRK